MRGAIEAVVLVYRRPAASTTISHCCPSLAEPF